ncbi:uncharacterized protein LOC120287221 [Eucalyptus grandis]|uniref:uncharacterized protein LOC120287221 n=1 Tax=Eucalyptus grandis TaxID=71139 RepID=UPI00192EAF09|nr:uncharacterized protein LOC120287221 [Eucalyptus grandis]
MTESLDNDRPVPPSLHSGAGNVVDNPESFQLLELNIISAQDLAMVARTMRTYAVAWVHPDRKLSTRVDSNGRNSPTWNDKFVFRVDEEFLRSDTSGVMIEIYAVHWFKDVLVGRVRVLVGHLVTPQPHPFRHQQHHVGMRFVALQVRRPSGRPQGILNIGVAVLDSSMRSMPLYMQLNASAVGYRDLMGEEDPYHHHHHHHHHHNNNLLPSSNHPNQQEQPQRKKPELRRTKSDTSSIMAAGQVKTLKRKVSFLNRPNSVINGSEDGNHKTGSDMSPNPKPYAKAEDLDMAMVPFQQIPGAQKPLTKNAALDFEALPSKPGQLIITESELGPSPSEVAAAVAAKERYKEKEVESPVVGGWSLNESVEGLQSKLERWRMELPTLYDRGDYSSLPSSGSGNNNNIVKSKSSGRRHVRRHTDGGGGGSLFSCVGNICGLECTIVCGNNEPP